MTLLGGLPYDTSQVSYLTLLSYILLLLLVDCAGGIPAARLALRPRSFVLVRAGWRRWFGQILRRCSLSVLAVCGILLIPALIRHPTRTTLCAWLLFTLHMETAAAVQVLLIALFRNVAAALIPVLFLQLASVLLSVRLPGPWAVLLPPNWGSLFRTSEYELPRLSEAIRRVYEIEQASTAEGVSEIEQVSKEDYANFVISYLHGGFPLWSAIVLNLSVLLPIPLSAWRLVRRRNRKTPQTP